MTYFEAPGVNWSSLKHMRDSPMAYRYNIENPPADKEVLAIGRAIHCAVFEPDQYGARFSVFYGAKRAGSEWNEFVVEHEGTTILRAVDNQMVQNVANAVLSHPLAAQYISGGTVEQPIFWTDPATGLRCKAKPDLIHSSTRILLDLKSCRSADGRRFGAESARFAYPQQLAHYRAGCEHGLGWRPEKVLIVAVEKTAPHDVGVFEVDPVALDIAAQEVESLLQRLKECRATEQWPGRYTELQALQLPAWVYEDEDEDDANGFGLSFGGA